MALFQRKEKQESETREAFSEYVDSLLDNDQPGAEQALKPAYGIDQAIELMSKVPRDNPEVVVAVIRETLRSANIDVDAIIVDAENKSESLQAEISGLRDRIAALQEEIQQKEGEIQRSQKELKETARVQELLKASARKNSAAQVSNNSDSDKSRNPKMIESEGFEPVQAGSTRVDPVQEKPPAQSQQQGKQKIAS